MAQQMITTGLTECVSDCLKGKEETGNPAPKGRGKPRASKIVQEVEAMKTIEELPTPKRKRKSSANNSIEDPLQPPTKKPRQTKAKPVEKIDPTIEDLYEMVKQNQSVLTQFMDEVTKKLEETQSILNLRNKHGF